MNQKYIELILGYQFRDINLLKQALTHKSFSNEKKKSYSNERLEFLGDAVLELIVTQYLFTHYSNNEGELTKLRAQIVREETLAFLARKFGINKYIVLGKGEDSAGGREKDSLLADCLEALIGAVFSDSNFDIVYKTFYPVFESLINELHLEEVTLDYKSMFQEYTQKVYKTRPEYFLIEEKGPDHCKEFSVIVKINDETWGFGIGKSKKEAEQNAAKIALETHKK